ncbi:hypothetical protein ACTXT7_001094 [Hymenolepis weldensis]
MFLQHVGSVSSLKFGEAIAWWDSLVNFSESPLTLFDASMSVCGPSLIRWNKWTALSLAFSNNKGFFAKPTLTVYVDNDKVFEEEFCYPLIKEDLLLFHYGGCPSWVEETCYSSLALKLSAKNLRAKAPPVKQSSVWSSLRLGGVSSQSKRPSASAYIEMGEERPLWGPLNSFRGRLSYAVVFNESASKAFIQWLVQGDLL